MKFDIDNLPISQGLDFAGMYVNAATKPIDQAENMLDYQQSGNGRVDIGDLQSRRYRLDAMSALSNVGKGISTGASLGGPKGAVIGGAIGLGAGLVDIGRQLHERSKFRQEQRRLVAGGAAQNANIDYRDKVRNAVMIDQYNTLSDFYGR